MLGLPSHLHVPFEICSGPGAVWPAHSGYIVRMATVALSLATPARTALQQTHELAGPRGWFSSFSLTKSGSLYGISGGSRLDFGIDSQSPSSTPSLSPCYTFLRSTFATALPFPHLFRLPSLPVPTHNVQYLSHDVFSDYGYGTVGLCRPKIYNRMGLKVRKRKTGRDPPEPKNFVFYCTS